MLVTTTRTHKSTDGSFGILTIDTNSFKCVFLERTAVQIPVGIFPIKWLWSEHFQQFMPHIMNVPGRIAIEQHWANYPNQLDGCQALGEEEDFKDDCIEQSKEAWKVYCGIIINEPNVMLKVIEDYAS